MIQITHIAISPKDTFSKVLEIFNQSGTRTIIVTDENSILLGIITDGNIRNALLKSLDLRTPASLIMNPNPIIANESDTF